MSEGPILGADAAVASKRSELLEVMEQHFPVETKTPVRGQRVIPFRANEYQLQLDSAFTEGFKWHDVIKCRQVGISTFVDYRLLAKCLTVSGTHAAIVSHERQATARLLRRVHFVLGDLKAKGAVIGGHPVDTKYSSKFEITFPHKNSSLYIGTAGQRAFSRGDMLTDIHGSEVAYWPNAGELMSGVIGALTADAEVVLESTGNGMGGYFYERIMSAAKRLEQGLIGDSKLHFFPWHHFSEYQREVPKDVLWSPEERDLQRRYGLTENQLSWRRWKINQYEKLELFLQEFPLTLEEAFLARGECYFDKLALRDYQRNAKPPLALGSVMRDHARASFRRDDSGPLKVYEMPRPGAVYLIAADSSEGRDGDPAAAVVLDRETNRQAAWLNGALDPHEFGDLLYSLGMLYNWATIAPEDNAQGLATVLELVRLGYPKLYRGRRVDDGSNTVSEKFGWHTDGRTRPLILSELRRAIRTHSLGAVDADFLKECTTFCKQLDGHWRANSGCNDDRVIVQAIATYLHATLPMDRSPLDGADRGSYFENMAPPPREVMRGWKTGY